jgi:hypothetical protein
MPPDGGGGGDGGGNADAGAAAAAPAARAKASAGSSSAAAAPAAAAAAAQARAELRHSPALRWDLSLFPRQLHEAYWQERAARLTHWDLQVCDRERLCGCV